MSKLPQFPNVFGPVPNPRSSIRSYRIGALRDYTKDRMLPLLAANVVKHPTSIAYAWQVASILEL